jgi:hypothetical protein
MDVKAATLITSLLALLPAMYAQGPCPTALSTTTQPNLQISKRLICTVNQIYGGGGLVGVSNKGPLGSTDQNSAAFKHSVHFQDSSLASFVPLTSAIGSALSQLPLTSPASGFTFSFNSSLGVYARTTENFGPILSERADTIGKHKLFVGVSYQYFNFDEVDGVNLHHFAAVFQHEPEPCPTNNPNNITCINNTGPPAITKDYVSTQNRIDLKAHQVTAVATFGFTDRFDVSAAIPILVVGMDMTSAATINNFEATDASIVPACCVHQFAPPPAMIPGETLGQIYAAPSNGFQYYNNARFFRSNSAWGIGDLVFRAKYRVLKREKLGFALGGDFRAPTGDELNFLGSGTWGIRPFATLSYSGRFSPHANMGFQANGKSVLGGNISADTSARLPNAFTYSFGGDLGLSARASVSADFFGATLFNVPQMGTTATTTLLADNSTINVPGLVTTTGTSNQASVAVGGKINPFGRLLITANVLFRVNDAGLHYKPVPLVGMSYTF